jgi:uncharacterized membrane protein YbhN (UPF0104 family)
MSKPLRWSLASLILFAVVLWVELDIGWINVLLAWREVSALTLLGLTLLTLISYLLRAWRVHLYFGRRERHAFVSYVRISFLHNAMNNLLPMRLGEASFPLLMKRRFGYPLLRSSAGLLWIRLMDLHWLLVLLSLVGAVQFGPLALAATGLLILLPLLGLLPNLGRLLPARLTAKLALLRDYTPPSYGFALRIYALTAVVWVTKLSALTLMMLSFIDLPGSQGLLAVIFADLSSVLPIHGLAGSGTFEGAMLAALLPLGVDQSDILLAAVNVHLYLLGVTLLSVPLALLLPDAEHATGAEAGKMSPIAGQDR